MLNSTSVELNILEFDHIPIFEQLRLEEALLRAGTGNWCIINRGSDPAVVMGISAVTHEVVDVERAKREAIPLIRRFSGGGTVVVDEETLFFTIILDEKVLSQPNTHDMMLWTHEILVPLFNPHLLELEEQDYALDNLKVGGNAQCFASKRVLHHTSFLWSWKQERMSLLSVPKRQPLYRKDRQHGRFCNRLSNYFPSKDHFITMLIRRLRELFNLKTGNETEVRRVMALPYRQMLQFEGKSN